jgi:hypothetical protein
LGEVFFKGTQSPAKRYLLRAIHNLLHGHIKMAADGCLIARAVGVTSGGKFARKTALCPIPDNITERQLILSGGGGHGGIGLEVK